MDHAGARGLFMKRAHGNKHRPVEKPIWCDHCRVRIAPYEEVATSGTKAFHARCFQKEETAKSQNGPIENSGLTLALA